MNWFGRSCLIAIGLVAGLCSSKAQEFEMGYRFYWNRLSEDNNFTVAGATYKDGSNPDCSARTVWPDGSDFFVFKDLKDQELYLRLKNVNWELSDKPGTTGTLRINFRAGGRVAGGDYTFIVMNKNTIAVPDIANQGQFMQNFASFAYMQFVMPGNIPNAEIPLRKPKETMAALAECARKFKADPELLKPKKSPPVDDVFPWWAKRI